MLKKQSQPGCHCRRHTSVAPFLLASRLASLSSLRLGGRVGMPVTRPVFSLLQLPCCHAASRLWGQVTIRVVPGLSYTGLC